MSLARAYWVTVDVIGFDHSSTGISDKYAGHMITTDKTCSMLELLLISRSSKTLKIILENDYAEHHDRLCFKNIILLAKIYSNLTENFGK